MNAYAQKEQKAPSEKDNTGIPAQMKMNFERSSGFSFDDVRVHYNSEKPAQLHAHAYTQGNEVYVAPGQEKHLPHELGHVVQQKSNAVQPTGEIGDMPLNDDESMEDGADKLAELAENSEESDEVPLQAKAKDGGVVQRREASEGSYNYYAGEMSGVSSVVGTTFGIAGGIGTFGSFLYSKNSARKHKYIEEIDKYADAACEARDEQVELLEQYDLERGTPAKIKGKIKKTIRKIKRNYESALSKAHAMGEFENGNKKRWAFSRMFFTKTAKGEPPKAGNENNAINNVYDKNVKAALLRAKEAYEESLIEDHGELHLPPPPPPPPVDDEQQPPAGGGQQHDEEQQPPEGGGQQHGGEQQQPPVGGEQQHDEEQQPPPAPDEQQPAVPNGQPQAAPPDAPQQEAEDEMHHNNVGENEEEAHLEEGGGHG